MKKLVSAGIRSVAVSMPKEIRTNDYFRNRYPALVENAEKSALARIWQSDGRESPFELEMRSYLKDPFRGTVERRVLDKGSKVMTLEIDAAKKALSAAKMSVCDIDLLICCSFIPDQYGIGNATPLAKELGLKSHAFNLETACSSTLVAIETACGLVQAGQFRNVLVVFSCTYSRVADETDSLCWFFGDGAGAFVVGQVPDGEGLLGMSSMHTGATCGSFYYENIVESSGPRLVARNTPEAGTLLRDTAEEYLRSCVNGALKDADMRLRDIDFFVFNTPTAWHAKFCTQALGVDADRSISTYTRYANMGPALMPVNLHEAAVTNRIKEGDRVLLYSVGSVSSTSAAIFKWGQVGVGPRPE